MHTGVLYVGAYFGCQGLVSIYGWARQTYLYSLFQDCTATITNRPGAKWGLGATYLGGTRFRFGASGPLGARVIRPNPVDSGCGSYGTAHFNSQLFVRLKSLTTVPAGLIDQWGDQIGAWLTQQQDQQANQSIIRDPLNIDVPVNGSLSGQGVPITGSGPPSGSSDLSAASAPVFTLSQRLRAGVLTALQIHLTALGQSLLAGSAPLPKLKITLKFAPSHGRARTVTRTVTPPPPLPAG